jgi:hypothetical protein
MANSWPFAILNQETRRLASPRESASSNVGIRGSKSRTPTITEGDAPDELDVGCCSLTANIVVGATASAQRASRAVLPTGCGARI